MSPSASGITSKTSPPARSTPPGRKTPCGPIFWRRSPLRRTVFLPNGIPARATISISPTIPTTTSTLCTGAIFLPISAASWMRSTTSTSAGRGCSIRCLPSTATAPPSPAKGSPSGAPFRWPTTATRRSASCAITTAAISSLPPPRSSGPSAPPIRAARSGSAAPGKRCARWKRSSTASAATIRPFPPSAMWIPPSPPRPRRRSAPSSASSISPPTAS